MILNLDPGALMSSGNGILAVKDKFALNRLSYASVINL